MSFPEGSPEGARSDEHGSSPTAGMLATITRPLRRHIDTWAGRYVEMRVDARR